MHGHVARSALSGTSSYAPRSHVHSMAGGEVDAGKIKELRDALEPRLQGAQELRDWCSDRCLARYLRARKLDVAKAQKMLEHTLEWRKSYKPHKISWDDVKEEGCTGKIVVTDFTDKEGRTVVLMRPRCENSKNVEQQIRFLVYNLERASRFADQRGVEKMSWLIDFNGYSMRNAASPRTGLQTLSILQNHYPERLGLSIMYHPPALFSFTWKACSPFIDPITYQKIFFCEKGPKGDAIMQQHFDMRNIEESMGGTSTAQFDLSSYEKQQVAGFAVQNPPEKPNIANGIANGTAQ